MRFFRFCLTSVLVLCPLFAQGDRGTITGTIADPAGAVVANAPVEARNPSTGSVTQVASTATGNYTLANLPAGQYELKVTVPGFKTYVRQNIDVQVAQTLRIDIALEVGSASESVTVTAEVSLLKTESGDLSHNVESARLNALPVLGLGEAAAGTSGIRNPLAVTQLAPGTYYKANSDVRVNGAPANTQSIRVEGMESANGLMSFAQAQTQPSVDAIQELTIQTSNFAAEYGQAGGGVFNFTMKSGTNQFHGTAYDYFVNEALNASQPFVNTRQRQRRQDFGFTFGGPVTIPKLYNGHDKTFFFINWEKFIERQFINNQAITVPTDAYRAGNFAAASTGRQLALDPLGRPIIEGNLYDPSTTRIAPNGQRIRDLYPGNTIPPSQFDPVAVRLQNLIPRATLPGLQNNGIYPYPSERDTGIPAVKVDHNISSRAKVSYYWSKTSTASQFSPTRGASEGFPDMITATRGTFITSYVNRVNFDYTLRPTVLMHVGLGYQTNDFDDHTAKLDVDPLKEIGLKGGTLNRQFPSFRMLTIAGRGGVNNIGPGGQARNLFARPSANLSFTWVKNNHTYKFGGDFRIEGTPTSTFTNVNGLFNFSGEQTGLPSTQGQNLAGGTVGFPYASLLLGRVGDGNVSRVAVYRAGKQFWAGFAQDTWKVTRRLTLDYGIRYDFSTYPKEQYGRGANFSATTPNPSAGGRLGASIYEGSGPGQCNCNFAKNYPWAFGPRLGIAYQINPKTVLRIGAGVNYFASTNTGVGTVQSNNPWESPSFGDASSILADGIPINPIWPNLSAGQFPIGQTVTGTLPAVIDQNYGRPARQTQWSIGIQREIRRNLVVEGSYVGNRGTWWRANNLNNINALTPQILARNGLDLNSAADRTIINARLDSANAGRFRNQLPYSGFPTSATVAQALRPFPQFGTLAFTGAPIGNTWYDSFQAKVTKRYSYGLDFTYTFTWQKELALGAESDNGGIITAQVNDVFNRGINKSFSGYSKPLVSFLAVNYRLQPLTGNKWVRTAVKDWVIGGVLGHSSGQPIRVPNANNQLATVLFRGTQANRVPGEPLFTQDLNCHCFDPERTFVLNPKAWSDPAPGQFGTSSLYYNDYRYQRRPDEALSLAREFRFTERARFQIRAEFSNIFNRTRLADPVPGTVAGQSFTSTQQRNNTTGLTTGGFGWINTAVTTTLLNNVGGPRTGTLVARITF